MTTNGEDLHLDEAESELFEITDGWRSDDVSNLIEDIKRVRSPGARAEPKPRQSAAAARRRWRHPAAAPATMRVGATGGGQAATPAVGAPGAKLIIVSGPSGVGKDTIMRYLLGKPSVYPREGIVTYKTRPPREGERDGIDYHFVSVGEFEKMRRDGELLEASEVHGHWSGTPRGAVADALVRGVDAVIKIDVQGADKVKSLIPGAVRIFVAPPSDDVLRARLTARGTETAEEQTRRERDVEFEMNRRAEYDHLVVNEIGKSEKTAAQIDRIIRNEHARHPDQMVALRS